MAKRILIVDDERDVLSVLGKGLTKRGYSVILADNGGDAIMLAKSEHPDLIVLDILMPGMDGTEVAAELRENPETEDIPVMFLTCLYPKEKEVERGNMIGVHLMFAKPYDIEEMLTAIETLMREKKRISVE